MISIALVIFLTSASLLCAAYVVFNSRDVAGDITIQSLRKHAGVVRACALLSLAALGASYFAWKASKNAGGSAVALVGTAALFSLVLFAGAVYSLYGSFNA